MKHLICILAIVLGVSLNMNSIPTEANLVQGTVIYDGKSDYHIIKTDRWYVLAEWYAGPDFSKGDTITGELHAYGYKMVKVNKQEKETRIYIENYWSSKEKCLDWLKEHDKLK